MRHTYSVHMKIHCWMLTLFPTRIFYYLRVRTTMVGYIFTGVCLFRWGGGGCPSPTVPGSFPGFRSQALSRGYPSSRLFPSSFLGEVSQDRGIPHGQVRMGYPLPGQDGVLPWPGQDGVPLARSGWGTPCQVRMEYSPGQVRMEYPLASGTLRQNSRAGGMPLAFTPEDFLVIN